MSAPTAVSEQERLEIIRRLRAEAGIPDTISQPAPLPQPAPRGGSALAGDPGTPPAAAPNSRTELIRKMRAEAGMPPEPPGSPEAVATELAPIVASEQMMVQGQQAFDLLRVTQQFLGTPYVWGGNKAKKGIDCSGFTCQVYKQAGVNLPRTARLQSKQGKAVPWDQMQPGDAIYFDMKNNGDVTHTGIYMGNGRMRHASSSKGVVEVTLDDYWKKRAVTQRRFLGTGQMVDVPLSGPPKKPVDNVSRETPKEKPRIVEIEEQLQSQIKRRERALATRSIKDPTLILRLSKDIDRLRKAKNDELSKPEQKRYFEAFKKGGVLGVQKEFAKIGNEAAAARHKDLVEGAPTFEHGRQIAQALGGANKRYEKISGQFRKESNPAKRAALQAELAKVDAYRKELRGKQVNRADLAAPLPVLTEKTFPIYDKRVENLTDFITNRINARATAQKQGKAARVKALDVELQEARKLLKNISMQMSPEARRMVDDPAFGIQAKRREQEVDLQRGYMAGGNSKNPLVRAGQAFLQGAVYSNVNAIAGAANMLGIMDDKDAASRSLVTDAGGPKNPSLGENVISGIGSVAASAATAIPIGGALGTLVKSAKAAKWAAPAVFGLQEAAVNGGNTYQSLRAQGKSAAEAKGAATKQVMLEAVPNILAAKFGLFNEAKGVTGVIARATPEALQEGYQRAIQNISTGKQWDEGIGEDALVGGLVGLIFSVGNAAFTGRGNAKLDRDLTMQLKAAIYSMQMEKPVVRQGAEPKTKFEIAPIAGTKLPAVAKSTAITPFAGKGEAVRRDTQSPKSAQGAEITYRAYKGSHRFEAFDSDGSKIGGVSFIEKDGFLVNEPGSTLFVDDRMRRKGVATALYVEAERQLGMKVKPGGNLTGAGRMFWEQSNRPFGVPTPTSPTSPANRVPTDENVEQVAPQRKQMGVEEPVDLAKVKRKAVPEENKGARGKVVVPQMDDVEFSYAVVDIKDLVISHDKNFNPNPKYAEALQPRDRAAANLKKQVEGIAKKFDPRQVADSIHAATGAPIIGPDHIVEVGNGRLMAFKKAPVSRVKAYRDYLTQNAEKFGLTPEQIASVKSPILVRVRETEMDQGAREEFARRANEDITAAESTTDQARTDATILSDDVTNLLVENETGDISNPANARFAAAFVNKMSTATRTGMMDSQGSLSQEGIRRIEGAILNKAYNSKELTALAIESADANVKRILTGLKSAAPAYLKYKSAVEKGDAHNLDISTDIVDTVLLANRLRDQGMSFKDYVEQDAMFDTPADTRAKELLNTLAIKTPTRGAIFDSAKRTREFLQNYVELALKQGKPSQGTLVKGSDVKSRDDLIRQAAAQVAGETASLFDTPLTNLGAKLDPLAEKPKNLMRNFRSGLNDVSMTFASEAQRDAYDFVAAQKQLQRDRNLSQSTKDKLLKRITDYRNSHTRDEVVAAREVYDDVRAQMSGGKYLDSVNLTEKLDPLAEKKRIETEDTESDPILGGTGPDGTVEMATGIPGLGRILTGFSHYMIRGTGFIGDNKAVKVAKNAGHAFFSDVQSLLDKERAPEVSRDLHEVVLRHDELSHQFMTLITAEVKAVYGNLGNLLPSAVASLRGETTSIPYKKAHNIDLTSKEQKIWDVWVKVSTEINRMAKELGIQVERVVGEHPSKDKLMGKDVTFFLQGHIDEGRAPNKRVKDVIEVGGVGERQILRGKITGVTTSAVLIEAEDGTKYKLAPGVRFYTETLVDPDAFFPMYVKEDVLDKLKEGTNSPEYTKQVQWLLDQQLAKSVTEARSVIFEAIRGDAVYVNGIARSRLQAARKGRIFHPDFYEYDLERGAERYIRAATLDIAASETWGADKSKLAEKVINHPDAKRIVNLVQSMVVPPDSTAVTRDGEKAAKHVGSLVALSYLGLSASTMITQIGATAQMGGTLGYYNSMMGMGDVLKAKFSKGNDLIDEILMSGVTDQDLASLFAGDKYEDKFTDLVRLSLKGMRVIDGNLRIISAAAGIAATARASRGIIIDNGGKIKDNAHYRFLSDWARYQDSEIRALAADTKALYETGNNLRVKAMFAGVKTQVTTRAIDRSMFMHNNPAIAVALRLHSYGAKQAQLMGWTLKEASKGNLAPFFRLMLAGALVGEGVGWLKELFKEHLLYQDPKDSLANGKKIVEHIKKGEVTEALGEFPSWVLENNVAAGTFGLYSNYFGDFNKLEKVVVANMFINLLDAVKYYYAEKEHGNAFYEWANKQFAIVKQIYSRYNEGKTYRQNHPVKGKNEKASSGKTAKGSKPLGG